MKILTFAVPCYNSEAYMEKCIDSLLVGGEDVGDPDGRWTVPKTVLRKSRMHTRKAYPSDRSGGISSGKQRARRCCKCGTRQCHRTLF